MRNLSPTLLAAQQAGSHVPYVKIEASNRVNGLVRLDWERLYSGTEDEYYHALAVCGDRSLVRVRITLPSDGRKLYRQTVTNPGLSSDFSSWTYTNQLNCIVVAAAALGNEVSIFWANTNKEIRRIVSTNYGISWGNSELIDYSSTTSINGMAAAYKSNGDLALFYTDQATLYVKKRVAGIWQSKSAWDKVTGDLSGIAVIYDQDWILIVTGTELSDDLRLWSLVYGDGGTIPAGSWSTLGMIASAPAGGDYNYSQPFIDKPDVFRGFFVEKFTGNQAYSRPYQSYSIPETEYEADLWRDPIPCDISASYGLAIGHSPLATCWLSSPNGVWWASLTPQLIDLTAEVCSVELDIEERQGRLAVDIRNDDGRYSILPVPIGIGCQIDVSPGYVTTVGSEVSRGQTFILESYEHYSKGAQCGVLLKAVDGWGQLKAWKARDQFRWNKSSPEKSLKNMLAFILARAGLRLETKTESAFISGYCPDFMIHPGDSGYFLVDRLLSYTPDTLFIEGATAYLVNPQLSDISCYIYGTAHVVFEERFINRAEENNWVKVEGYDPDSGQSIMADIFNWGKIKASSDRHSLIRDLNLNNASHVQQRGEAFLRKVDMDSLAGELIVPVNCGQQLYDVIDISDIRNFNCTRRVSGLELHFDPARGKYMHRFTLTGV